MNLVTFFRPSTRILAVLQTIPRLLALLAVAIFGLRSVYAADIPAGFSEKLLDANGQKIHCVIGGNGPPIVLIHGWPETWYEWRKAMSLLAD